MKKLIKNQSGSILVSILIISLFFVTITSALIVLANANIVRAKDRVMLLQAQYSAESGADVAISKLNNSNEAYTGTGGEVQILSNSRYRSTFNVVVSGSGKKRTIESTGYVYIPANNPTATISRKISVEAEKSSSTNTSSMVSQFNIDVNSAVKTVQGKNIYVNGYINMNKNSTYMVSEDITVVGKNTSASNCSIGGAGNLQNPSSFSVPGQTKMNVKLGFNNCVTLDGGASKFNLLTNQTSLTKIQSTLVPVSQYMDNTYQNSVGGDCRDWTTGGTTRQIPSTGNTKKTHYPDSQSSISTSCSSGNIDLGTNVTYVLNDHAHVRANFCYQKTCRPTFKNPVTDPNDPNYVKYLFVEGAVYFDSIRTTSDSGPIVLVAYGTDADYSVNNSLTSDCTFVPSIFLGQGQPGEYTDAPDMYLLAPNNAVCLEKTKFGANPSLGGISGKNIYINSNSGTPFDLFLDPNFPTNQIQVDLAWRAIKYRRM